MVDARKPVAAGVFYPGDRDALERVIRSLLDRAPAQATAGTVRGLVAPHGVIGTPGIVAAAAWSRVAVQAGAIRRVLLLGPSHHVPFAGIAAPFADSFATPLGGVPVDQLAIEGVRRFPQLVVGDLPHEQEPSLEAQLPFVQVLLPGRPIIPLLVGDLPDTDAATVVDALWDATTLAVVSTDLSHYFDATTAARLDEATASAVEHLEGLTIDEERACGHAALRALLLVARARRMRATRLELRQSGDGAPDAEEVVGYGAFALG